MHYLRAERLTFSYGEETIYRNFSFELNEGEHLVLKGRSGIGKSTLFRLILGFDLPDEGSIYYRGEPLKGERIKKLRQKVAWLPQDLNIGKGTVREVLEQPMAFRNNRDHQPAESGRASLMKKLGLEQELLDKPWSRLSTGQRQRMGFVLLLILDKPLLLLDEPTSALDSRSKEHLGELLFKGRKKTVLSTSHDPFWVDLGDRVVDLDSEFNKR